jgi:hypothetical protein
MAEPDEEVTNLFRLIAIEVLLTETLAIRYLGTSDPVGAAATHREHMRQVWSQVAAPFLQNAADSELVIGGIGDAIDELIERAAQMASGMAGEQQKPRGPAGQSLPQRDN